MTSNIRFQKIRWFHHLYAKLTRQEIIYLGFSSPFYNSCENQSREMFIEYVRKTKPPHTHCLYYREFITEHPATITLEFYEDGTSNLGCIWRLRNRLTPKEDARQKAKNKELNSLYDL